MESPENYGQASGATNTTRSGEGLIEESNGGTQRFDISQMNLRGNQSSGVAKRTITQQPITASKVLDVEDLVTLQPEKSRGVGPVTVPMTSLPSKHKKDITGNPKSSTRVGAFAATGGRKLGARKAKELEPKLAEDSLGTANEEDQYSSLTGSSYVERGITKRKEPNNIVSPNEVAPAAPPKAGIELSTLKGPGIGKESKPGVSPAPNTRTRKPGLRNNDVEQPAATDPGASHTSSTASTLPVLRGLRKNRDNDVEQPAATDPGASHTYSTASTLPVLRGLRKNRDNARETLGNATRPVAMDNSHSSNERGIQISSELPCVDNTSTSTELPPRPSHTGLVEARPVTGKSSYGLQQAEELTEQEATQKRKMACWVFIMGAVIGLVLLVGVVIYFVLRHPVDKESKLQPTKDTPAESLPINEYILTLLPDYTTAQIHLEDYVSLSPQTLAFQWLLEDPYLKTYPDWRKIQRYAMATIYYATKGDAWKENKDWLSYEIHENEWHWSFSSTHAFEFPGDPLNYVKGTTYDEVKHLWLFNNNLVGTIPPEIGLLTSLLSFDLVKNGLQGTIPSQIENLKQLAFLMISFNDGISGHIPSEIGLIPDLKWLSASDCGLTGAIPTELGVPRLWSLQVDRNNLQGPIPSELGQLSELLWFIFNDNQFTSTIPSELGQISSLQTFHVFSNKLSGQIPSELGLFGMAKIADFSKYFEGFVSIFLSGNSLGGAFETALKAGFHFANDYSFRLHSNRLKGTIPSELALLTMVPNFDCTSLIGDDGILLCNGIELQNNALLGTLPVFSPTVEYVDVSFNNITGSIPDDMGIGWLQHLDVSHNALTGSIPAALDQWSNLMVFNASHNQLMGTISPELEAMVSTGLLTEFQLSGNPMITGTIPAEFCKLPHASLGFTCSEILCGCSCTCPRE